MSMGSPIRPPAVAGRFYPADPAALRSEVGAYLADGGGDHAGAAAPARGVLAPHAGYVYSGAIAGKVFSRTTVPESVIVLAPNHTGRGQRIAVASRGAFRLPGGDVAIDEALADEILAEVRGASADTEAHRFEHAVEVELPFVVARRPDVRIVPIVLGGVGENEAIELGRSLHRACARAGRDALVVASSDMSHYLPDAETRAIDRVALEPLLAFDPAGLYRTVRARGITMCGFIPATAMLSFAREAGATAAPALVGYGTSGDAFGDRDRVVGYAGVVVR